MGNGHHEDEWVITGKWSKVLVALLTVAITAVASNLWYLNMKAVEFEHFQAVLTEDHAVLKGAMPRTEAELQYQLLLRHMEAIDRRLARIDQKLDRREP